MSIKVENLYPAVDRVREHRFGSRSPEASFLRAYPALVAAARQVSTDPRDDFLRAAALAFAWIPDVLRIDDGFLGPAAEAFGCLRGQGLTIGEELIDPIANCLSSLVAASKVLHLANPDVFPIWDERVERFRLGEAPTPFHMGQTRNYLAFIEDVWTLTADPYFLAFHQDYCTAYQERLRRLHIAPYTLTEPRVVQSASSELAGG